MKYFLVNAFGFAIPGQNNAPQGVKESFYFFFSILSILALTGCVTSEKSAPLAPMPPMQFIADASSASQNFNNLNVAAGSVIVPDPQGVSQYLNDDEKRAMSLKASATETQDCALNDRFDRKALVAYEWDRSRLSMDVDGLGLQGANIDSVRVEYKIRLQPEKPKKYKCRYSSKWQGLVGSGYNELIVREGVAVTQEVTRVKNKVRPYIDHFF